MRHLVERHLERVGSRRAFLLTVLAILWGSVAVAVVVWAIGKGVMESVWITLAVASGEFVDIAVAIVLWTVLLITIPLVKAVREIWQAFQDERWAAHVALNELEAQLPDQGRNSRHLDNPHDRLALRGLEALETEFLGAPAVEGDLQPRVIALGDALRKRGASKNGPDAKRPPEGGRPDPD